MSGRAAPGVGRVQDRAGCYTGLVAVAGMRALTFWKTVTSDEIGLLDRVLEHLTARGVRFCVIGGQGVNAYVEPLVSLDLDLAVEADQIDRLEEILAPSFRVQRHAHSVNLSEAGSDLRVQFQTDPRYAAFVDGAKEREVLGRLMPVAAVEDVLQGKIWAAQDHERRPSKRQKDLADIARLIEAFPELRARVPGDVLAKLV